MLCRPGREPEPIESAFVARIQERAERDRERHGWRDGGAGAWNLRAPQMGMMGMNAMAAPGEVAAARFVSVAAGRDARMLYSIQTSHVGGLFEYDPAAKEEKRLVHKAGFNAESLAAHPTTGELAFCVRHGDGSSAIGVANADGSKHRVVTEGDSLDECPSWSAGEGRRVVFQSAGIARGADGIPAGLSAYRVEELDLDDSKMRVIVEAEAFDYLAPRLTADGTLYAIRRSYEPATRRVSPLGLLRDIVFFPFRLLMAIAAFLNFFSLFFRNAPLYSAGGPAQKRDARPLMLWGRMIDTKKALAKSGKEESLIGPDWKLVRRGVDGAETIVAERVLHFDLCPQGVLYTNGSRVWLLAPDGTTMRLATGQIIERVAALPV